MCIKLKGVWRTVKTQKSFYLQLEFKSQTLSCATLPELNQLFASVCLSGLFCIFALKVKANVLRTSSAPCYLPSKINPYSSRMKNRISIYLLLYGAKFPMRQGNCILMHITQHYLSIYLSVCLSFCLSVCLHHFIFHLFSTLYFQRTLTLSKNEFTVLLLPSSPISFLTFLQRTI